MPLQARPSPKDAGMATQSGPLLGLDAPFSAHFSPPFIPVGSRVDLGCVDGPYRSALAPRALCSSQAGKGPGLPDCAGHSTRPPLPRKELSQRFSHRRPCEDLEAAVVHPY